MKKIEPVPYMDNMTLTENSFLVVDINDKKEEVLYYTPEQDEEPMSFEEFAHFYIAEEFIYSVHTDGRMDITKEVFTASGSKVESYEDTDGERNYEVLEGNGQIVTVYKKADLSKLDTIVESTRKDLKDMISEAKVEFKDEELYHKDPYAYHGVSRKDFY